MRSLNIVSVAIVSVSGVAIKQKRPGKTSMAARQPTSVDLQIGRLIRERRLQLSLNLQQLAHTLGIAVQQLQKYETGENRVAASRLVDISRALNVPVAWFFDRAGASDVAAENAPRMSAASAIELLTIFDGMSSDEQIKLIEIAKLLGKHPA